MTVEVLPRKPTLDELAEIANNEHAAVESDLRSAIAHGIAAGEAIFKAHEHFPAREDWEDWMQHNLHFNHSQQAGIYERLYRYQDRLPVEAFEPWIDKRGAVHRPSAIHAVRTYLVGLPPIRPRGQIHAGPRQEARRLFKTGMPIDQIAELLGTHPVTIKRWTGSHKIDKARRARYNREYQAAKKALRREQRAAEARRIGGSIADVYANTRRSLQIADSTLTSAESTLLRREVSALISELHHVEDRIGRIMRLGQSD